MSIRVRGVFYWVRAGLFSLWAFWICTTASSIALGEPGKQDGVVEKGDSQNPAGEGVVIEDIRVQVEKGVSEKVLIYSKSPFTARPFALEGEKPRIAIDIPNAQPPSRNFRVPDVQGEFIKRIRTHYHSDKGTIRVVLDLDPGGNYKVNQIFFEAENIYMIEVMKQ